MMMMEKIFFEQICPSAPNQAGWIIFYTQSTRGFNYTVCTYEWVVWMPPDLPTENAGNAGIERLRHILGLEFAFEFDRFDHDERTDDDDEADDGTDDGTDDDDDPGGGAVDV